MRSQRVTSPRRRTTVARLGSAALAAALLVSAAGALAGTATYTISGAASGSFDGSAFTNDDFTFTMVATTSSIVVAGVDETVDPLVSTTVALAGFGAFTVKQPTTLGGTTFGEVALDQFEPAERNIFLFGVPITLDLGHSFAPVSSTFIEIIGDVIPTSGGDLQFVSTGPSADPVLTFAGTVTGVPEPATWALMLSGIGLGGASLRSRRRAAAMRPG